MEKEDKDFQNDLLIAKSMDLKSKKPKNKKNSQVAQFYQKLDEIYCKQFRKQKYDFCWRSVNELPSEFKARVTMHSNDLLSINKARFLLINHFPSTIEITSKVGLIR